MTDRILPIILSFNKKIFLEFKLYKTVENSTYHMVCMERKRR